MNPKFAITLRAKKLGILLKDARLRAGKTMKECGEALGLSGSTISAYERGNSSPSLPELEILSTFFKVPIDQFWKDKLVSEDNSKSPSLESDSYYQSRNQQIGARIIQSRTELGKTFDQITEATGVTYGRMKRFEAGETAIPIPELELLANQLELPLSELYESETEIGKWLSTQSAISDFLELSPEMGNFVTNPINRPYLEIAMNLSKLSADQIRAIAESLLEITI